MRLNIVWAVAILLAWVGDKIIGGLLRIIDALESD